MTDVTMDEGGTPLVRAALGDEYDAEEVLVKDESRNPTASVYDRAAAKGVKAAHDEDADGVTLYSAGNSAVSVAAYAGRAGLGCTAHVPTRARFDVKASVNVHGASMDVGGGIADARDRAEDADGFSLSPFAHEATVEGLREVGREIDDDGRVDAVVCPVGTGELLVALDDALDDDTALYAAQPEGCAPLVGDVGTPDTVVGELEDPAPPELDRLRSIADRRGGVATPDDGEALDACLAAARGGVSLSPSGGVALAAVEELDVSGTVAVVNTSSGRLYADALRNRMVYHGE